MSQVISPLLIECMQINGTESYYFYEYRRGEWLLRRLLRRLPEYRHICKGCKTGYLDGSRDLSRTRCNIKKCCLARGHIICRDCVEYESCGTVQSFLNPPATNTASTSRRWSTPAHGHAAFLNAAFLNAAQHWTCAYGKDHEQDP